MLRAQVLTALQRWDEAAALFDLHFDGAMNEGLKRTEACLLADRALCEQRLGRVEQARALADAAGQALGAPMHVDDRMVALARLAQVLEGFGQGTTAAAHRGQARALHVQHCALQQRMVAELDVALAGLDPGLL